MCDESMSCELARLLPDDDSIFYSPGFSFPRKQDAQQTRKARHRARRVIEHAYPDGSMVPIEEVIAFMDMAWAALRACHRANEELQNALQREHEQLLCEQEAYAKAVLEENTLEEDSGFLREHVQQLLQEKRSLQEKMEQLHRAHGYLLKERELMYDQLQVAEEIGDDTERQSLTNAIAIRLDRESKQRNELQDERDRLQALTKKLRRQLQEQQDLQVVREGQLLTCLVQTTRAHEVALSNMAALQSSTESSSDALKAPLVSPVLSLAQLDSELASSKWMSVELHDRFDDGLTSSDVMVDSHWVEHSSMGSESVGGEAPDSQADVQCKGVKGGITPSAPSNKGLRNMDSVSEVEAVAQLRRLHVGQ